MKIKKLLALSLCLVTVFALAGCGSSTSSEKKDKYIAVTEPTYPPFESTNDDGDVVGFDIDLIHAIAKDQGFKVEIKTMSFDSLVSAVESDQADMIIAGFNETKDRAKHVDFTDPYYKAGAYMMVKKDSKYNSESDLPDDVKIAVQTGTTTADYVKEMHKDGKCADPVVLDQHSTCVLQLDNGDVDVVAGDKPVLDQYVTKHPDKYKLIGHLSYEDGDTDLKMAVGKDDDTLKQMLNDGLKDVMEDGTYDKLCKKWGLTPMEH